MLTPSGAAASEMLVALLAEGVDRNWLVIGCHLLTEVALLAEGVDRNFYGFKADVWAAVALLAEGVDRNMASSIASIRGSASPSSRRAWIEIPSFHRGQAAGFVALLAEGVDRNLLPLLREP